MNIFYLDKTPDLAAQYHCDKHVVKMIVEYCQLLSTAHRIIDGIEKTELSLSGRRVKRWLLSDERDQHLYKASHVNHPSAVWTRQTNENYNWLFSLLECLLTEYTHRYGKTHKCTMLLPYLKNTPTGSPTGTFFEPVQAMPDYCKLPGNSISAYRNYYIKEKKHFATWKNRQIPHWFAVNI